MSDTRTSLFSAVVSGPVDGGLLLLRAGFGLTMALAHGRPTLEQLLDDPSGYPDPIVLGPALSMTLMAFAELVCALAVALGLFTRWALIPLVFGFLVAVFVQHAGDPFGHRELAWLYLIAWGTLLATGPGRWSVDAVIGRRRRRRAAASTTAVATILLAALATAAPSRAAEAVLTGELPRTSERPLESIPGLTTEYGELHVADGVRLRTLLTRPEDPVAAPRPGLLFVQWLSCSTVELRPDADYGWARMMRGVLAGTGWISLRIDKAGVGDSEGGPCAELAYETELAHYREALRALRRTPGVDPDRIVVFGASMGATMAPLLADEPGVAGLVAWGGGARTWFERTLTFERQRREGLGYEGARTTRELRAIEELLGEFLIRDRSPEEMVAASPRLAASWDLLGGLEGSLLYGRSATFHQQAQDQDWAGAWERVEMPVLVLFGEHDWYEVPAASAWIADLVNRDHPGLARFELVPDLDHHFMRYPSLAAAVREEGGEHDAEPAVERILGWLAERFPVSSASAGE